MYVFAAANFRRKLNFIEVQDNSEKKHLWEVKKDLLLYARKRIIKMGKLKIQVGIFIKKNLRPPKNVFIKCKIFSTWKNMNRYEW